MSDSYTDTRSNSKADSRSSCAPRASALSLSVRVRRLLTLAVNAHVQQRTGSAMITACCAYWDKTTDGYASTKWESESVQVLVTVFGIAV